MQTWWMLAVRGGLGILLGLVVLLSPGAWSIFLAVLILRLPHAVTDGLVNIVGVYALIFGVLVSMAAILIRYGAPRVVVTSDAPTWMTR